MKVIHRTSTQLTLRLIPWGIWIFGGLFTIAGLLPSLFADSYRLTCDRLPEGSGTCEIRQSTLLQTRVQTFPLENLQGAEVVSFPSSEGNSDSHQLFLLLPEEPIPLSNVSSSDRQYHQDKADRINQFVQDSTQSNLELAEDLVGLKIIAFLFFSGSGLIVLAIGGQIMILEFDKLSNQFIFTRRGLLGSKRIEHPLKNIARCYVEQGSRNTSRIKFLLTSGETFDLTSDNSSGYQEKFRATQEIQSFLGLEPPKTIDKTIQPRSFVPTGRNILGLMFAGKEKQQQQLEAYHERLSREPEDLEAHNGIVAILTLQGKRQEAKAHLEKWRAQFVAEEKFHLVQLLDQAIAAMNR